MQKNTSHYAFTLPEILIAVSIFAAVTTVVASLYVHSFRETRRANLQNQIYEDARFVLQRIAEEVRTGMIDYDEYYNQAVIQNSTLSASAVGTLGLNSFGQNYGRYYSAFYNPGNDEALGFDCNTVEAADGAVGTPARTDKRNRDDCTLLRRTVDRITGSNPFAGKASGAGDGNENAFCATVSYQIGDPLSNEGKSADSPTRPFCAGGGSPIPGVARSQSELYLISADAQQKTILAREMIGGNLTNLADPPIYALSMLRLSGIDSDNDGLSDGFVCADGFECRGGDLLDVGSADKKAADAPCFSGAPGLHLAELPRARSDELNTVEISCDTAASGFSKDFVPISPLRVNITDLRFYITPLENPHYAFSETDEQEQPRVTIVLRVAPNPQFMGTSDAFEPITLVQTVSSRILTPIPAPILTR